MPYRMVADRDMVSKRGPFGGGGMRVVISSCMFPAADSMFRRAVHGSCAHISLLIFFMKERSKMAQQQIALCSIACALSLTFFRDNPTFITIHRAAAFISSCFYWLFNHGTMQHFFCCDVFHFHISLAWLLCLLTQLCCNLFVFSSDFF